MSKQRPILLAGIPRSGSTWAVKVLAQSPGSSFYHEPDNEKTKFLAYALKNDLHRFPYLRADFQQSDYRKLWTTVFFERRMFLLLQKALNNYLLPSQQLLEYGIGKKCGLMHEPGFFRHVVSPTNLKTHPSTLLFDKLGIYITRFATSFPLGNSTNRVIVKSVHAILSLPWIEKHFNPQIIVIFRNPLNVISSYLTLKIPDSIRNIFAQSELVHDHLAPFPKKWLLARTNVQKMAAQIGAIYKVLENQISDHPQWIIIKHEELCQDPEREYKKLYKQLDLYWNKNAQDFVKASNKKAEGFVTSRIARDEINKWKDKLTSDQVTEINRIIEGFNLKTYSHVR